MALQGRFASLSAPYESSLVREPHTGPSAGAGQNPNDSSVRITEGLSWMDV